MVDNVRGKGVKNPVQFGYEGEVIAQEVEEFISIIGGFEEEAIVGTGHVHLWSKISKQRKHRVRKLSGAQTWC